MKETMTVLLGSIVEAEQKRGEAEGEEEEVWKGLVNT